MPRYDYDDQDDDTDDHDDAHPWRQRLITWTLAALGLGLGFLIPYTLYLNHQVSQRFGALHWQIPTRVYARPLRLAPGLAMDAQTLKTELDAASYRDDGSGERLGTYASDGGRFTISSRGFADVDGKVPARKLQVSLSGGRVASVRDLGRKQDLKSARLDPARIATLYGQKQEERRLVRMEEVPELLVTGLQAVEDRDFSTHHGIDVSGILRAIWVTVRSGGETRQGASTLTQQLARSGLLGIGKEVTPSRKFNEILFALILEARYDKRTILEAYFNQVYLGQRGSQAIHGVAAASEFWFGRELDSLTTEQIALLIGIVKGPSYYDPRRNPERALDRRNFVLDKLLETELIKQAEWKRARAAPLGVTKTPGMAAANRFPAYVDLVRRQLARDYPESALQGAGLSVMTGMSPSAQAYAEGAVARDAEIGGEQETPAAAGRPGADRRARRRRAGRGRQPQCVPARLQPRCRSAAPGRLAAQAVRVPAGAGPAGQLFAGQLRRRFPGHRATRQGQALDPRQFRRPQPWHGAAGRCAGPFLQPGHGARRHGGRAAAAGRPDPGAGRDQVRSRIRR